MNPNHNPRGKISAPLIDAVFAKAYNVVAILLRHGAVPYITLRDDGTPLHYAAVFGYMDIVRLLVKYGADYNSLNKSGYTPLLLAIKFNNIGVAKHLIDIGASLYVPFDRYRETALTLACYGVRSA